MNNSVGAFEFLRGADIVIEKKAFVYENRLVNGRLQSVPFKKKFMIWLKPPYSFLYVHGIPTYTGLLRAECYAEGKIDGINLFERTYYNGINAYIINRKDILLYEPFYKPLI